MESDNLFLIVDLCSINQSNSFPVGLLLSPIEKVGSLKSKYITELLVVFRAKSERIEAIQQILSKKGIKCKSQKNIRRKIYAIKS